MGRTIPAKYRYGKESGTGSVRRCNLIVNNPSYMEQAGLIA